MEQMDGTEEGPKVNRRLDVSSFLFVYFFFIVLNPN